MSDVATNPVERAIQLLGGPTRALKQLTLVDPDPVQAGVSYWTMREWRRHGRVPDSRYAVLLSRLVDGQVSVAALAGLEERPNGTPKGKRGRKRAPGNAADAAVDPAAAESDSPPTPHAA